MKRYIYNLEQAYFYIQHNVMPIEPPNIHHKTRHVFFTFNQDETEEIYKLWCDQIPSNKNKRLF